MHFDSIVAISHLAQLKALFELEEYKCIPPPPLQAHMVSNYSLTK